MTESPTPFRLDPRLASDTHWLGELPMARALLMNDARFPWVILVPRESDLRDLIDLPLESQYRLLDDVNRVAHVLHALYKPDKLNIAALGNVVAQLHVHVIARFTVDAAWPRPVFGVGTSESYTADALATRIAQLRTALSLSGPGP
jgi:diadenosine tetraphosphate (Ap4A) HIT family hydrolase